MIMPHLNRYEVKVRTPKGNTTQERIVEATASSSWKAACLVLQMLGIESTGFSLSVHLIKEVHHA